MTKIERERKKNQINGVRIMVKYKNPQKTLESAACDDDIPEPTIVLLIAILNGRDSEKYQISFLSLSPFLWISFLSLCVLRFVFLLFYFLLFFLWFLFDRIIRIYPKGNGSFSLLSLFPPLIPFIFLLPQSSTHIFLKTIFIVIVPFTMRQFSNHWHTYKI